MEFIYIFQIIKNPTLSRSNGYKDNTSMIHAIMGSLGIFPKDRGKHFLWFFKGEDPKRS